MIVTCEVTAEDISQGLADDGQRCPVARAIRRAGFPEAFVDDDGWQERFSLSTGAHPIPKRVLGFIRAFDGREARGQLRPFRFRLHVPHTPKP